MTPRQKADVLRREIFQTNQRLIEARQRGDVPEVDRLSHDLATLRADLVALRMSGTTFQNRINAMC